MVVFAKFGRTTPLALLKDTIEITQVIEATAIAYFGNSTTAVH